MARVTDDFETAPELPSMCSEDPGAGLSLGMVVLYSLDDEGHIGGFVSAAGTETGEPRVFGRGVAQGDEHLRLRAVRQRPGRNEPLPPFGSPSLSRDQLLVRAIGTEALELTNVGQRPLAQNGRVTNVAHARPGDVLEIGSQLVLFVTLRRRTLPAVGTLSLHPFGEADAHGYVGESPAAWALRHEMDSMGHLPGHVLITGATGTGKEIVASAFHALSGRKGPLVARNAATFPESLVDAELFGNLKGYPNPGMPERKGLVGAADRGSLFLDEFAELAPEAQAKLLRVLDCGEYQTLGEPRALRSDFRLIAATNRPESALRPDLLARFDLRLCAPDLADRREDLPFLVRHLMLKMSEAEPSIRERFFSERSFPASSPAFVRSLVRRAFPANVRELRALLWQAVSKSAGGTLEWPSDVEPAEFLATPPEPLAQAAELARVLEENDGSIEKSWRALGLTSRYALMRLLRKHNVTVSRRAVRR